MLHSLRCRSACPGPQQALLKHQHAPRVSKIPSDTLITCMLVHNLSMRHTVGVVVLAWPSQTVFAWSRYGPFPTGPPHGQTHSLRLHFSSVSLSRLLRNTQLISLMAVTRLTSCVHVRSTQGIQQSKVRSCVHI